MRFERAINPRTVWGALAAGLCVLWQAGTAAETHLPPASPPSLLVERKPVFSEVLMVTNPPVSLSNPARLGTLVQPRLVTNHSAVDTHAPPRTATNYSPASTPSQPRVATNAATGPTLAAVPASGKVDSAAQARRMESLDSRQKLGVGDQLTFRVMEDQEDAKPLTVTDAGELDVPELGLVTAWGKTCRALAYEIKGKLEQTTYYHATVIVSIAKLNPTRVYVSGYVQRAGQQEIPAGETWTVAKAIMRAGGFTIYADRRKVAVVRAGQRGAPGMTYYVDMVEVLEKGRTDKDMAVQAEDFIIVPARKVLY